MSTALAMRPRTRVDRPVLRVHGRGRPSKLHGLMHDTPELYAKMLDLIRSGAFGWVVAESIGVAAETFSRWLSKGGKQQKGEYRQFRQDVQQAAAQSRVIAEVQVYRDDPVAWLRFGPGRTTPGRPGWTESLGVEESISQMNSTPIELQPLQNTDLLTTLRVFEQMGYISILPSGIASLGSADNAVVEAQAESVT